MVTRMDPTKCPTENLDLSNLTECNAAIQSLLRQHHVLQSWYDSALYECDRVLVKFSVPLCFGDKSIELTEKAFNRLEETHSALRDCNVKLKYIHEARYMDPYEETDNDRYIFKIIMEPFDRADAAYENILFATQRLIDSQIQARDGTLDRFSNPRSATPGMTTETASSSQSPSSSTSSTKRLPRPKAKAGAKAKSYSFVNFSTLTGKEKISAMMSRGYCTSCQQKKHTDKEKCNATGHKCENCGKINHFEKCCKFPKSPENTE